MRLDELKPASALSIIFTIAIATTLGAAHAMAAYSDRLMIQNCLQQDWPASDYTSNAELCYRYLLTRE